ncbi:MAG TPA: metallophosphoesterase [Archangium sp.]|uniref:metallophosphoesterase n=1 Tax=Archangium sp. TaxID=1872627 RepID=UPI002E36BFFC|nr:metallophosphoesterase [Archangium sp.]HEX5745613.1 metallophosphoesterase [Archangium sp.]
MPHKSLSLLAALTALLAFAGVSEAARLTRTPYLQSVTPTSALVAFRTDTDCVPRVRFGQGTDTSRIATAPTSGRLHVVKLEGLRAGTEHSYSVEACGATTQPVRFTTATPPGSGRVRFAAVGDFGTGATSEVNVGRTILNRKPDFFLGLGDGAYDNGTDAEHQTKLFQPLAPLLAAVPIYTTPGNHEYLTDKAQPYVDNFYLPSNNPAGTERYYSFDWGPAHVISLDSSCLLALGVAKGRCDQAAQRAWLISDLASTRQPWKIVFFHHPPYSSAAEHGSEVKLREMYAPVLEQYGVDMVLTGHDHTYERTHPMKGNTAAAGGVTYLVVGTGSHTKAFVPTQPSWSAMRSNRSSGYLDVTIEDGTLTGQMVSQTGAVLDTFRLTKVLAPRPRQPVLSAGLNRGSHPLEVLLNAQTSQEGATLEWDFGDGQRAEGETVSHVYDRPGSYTVTLTSTAGGQVLTHSLTVTAEATAGEPPAGEPAPGTEPGTQTPPPSGATPGAPSEAVPDLGLEPSPQAGCSATGAGAWLVLAAPLAWVLTRRRRRE